MAARVTLGDETGSTPVSLGAIHRNKSRADFVAAAKNEVELMAVVWLAYFMYQTSSVYVLGPFPTSAKT